MWFYKVGESHVTRENVFLLREQKYLFHWKTKVKLKYPRFQSFIFFLQCNFLREDSESVVHETEQYETVE